MRSHWSISGILRFCRNAVQYGSTQFHVTCSLTIWWKGGLWQIRALGDRAFPSSGSTRDLYGSYELRLLLKPQPRESEADIVLATGDIIYILRKRYYQFHRTIL